jgi:hypothetical protein
VPADPIPAFRGSGKKGLVKQLLIIHAVETERVAHFAGGGTGAVYKSVITIREVESGSSGH